jgi:hypothetical protein
LYQRKAFCGERKQGKLKRRWGVINEHDRVLASENYSIQAMRTLAKKYQLVFSEFWKLAKDLHQYEECSFKKDG